MTQRRIETSGIDHVVIYVRDVARAKRFYTEILGMTEHHGGTTHVFLRCGDQVIGLFEAADGDEPGAGHELNHIAFNIAAGSRAEAKSWLEANGVAVRGRRGDPDCLYFDDPDGHTLQIMARPAR